MADISAATRGSRFSAFLIDIDGTVVAGKTVLPGAAALLDYARGDGRRFVFATNNSRSWPAEVASWLTGLGLRCDEREVLTAGHLASQRAAQRSSRGVYVLGSPALAEMVQHAGGTVTAENPDVVLVGLDFDLSYERLSIACRAVGAGAHLIAVNRDLSIPTERGLEPGAGVLVHAVRTYGTGRMLTCGKPSPVLAHEARQRLAAQPEQMLMIGDSVASDMRMAARAGITGALVDTGVGERGSSGHLPAVAGRFPSLVELLAWLQQ